MKTYVSIRKKRSSKGFIVIDVWGYGIKTSQTTTTKVVAEAKAKVRAIENRFSQISNTADHEFHTWTKQEQKQFIVYGFIPSPSEDDTNQITTLRTSVKKYIEALTNLGKAFTTVSQYERELNTAEKFFGDIELKNLSASKIQEYADHLSSTVNSHGKNRGHKPKPLTVEKHIKALQRCLNYLDGKDLVTVNLKIFKSVNYGVEQPKETSKLTAWTDFESRVKELEQFGISQTTENAFAEIIYTKEQLDEQLEYLKQKLFVDGTVSTTRLYAAILFANATGCRRSELTRVQKTDLLLDVENPQATITKMKGRGKRPYLPQKMALPPIIIPVLKRLLLLLPENQTHIFCSDDKHGLSSGGWDEKETRSKADYLHKQLTEALEDSKWQHAAGWHIYRHTLASKLLLAGSSPIEVKQTIGWCSDEMAQRYQHLLHERKAQIINSVF